MYVEFDSNSSWLFIHFSVGVVCSSMDVYHSDTKFRAGKCFCIPYAFLQLACTLRFFASHLYKCFTHANCHASLINAAFEPEVFFKARVLHFRGKKKAQIRLTVLL